MNRRSLLGGAIASTLAAILPAHSWTGWYLRVEDAGLSAVDVDGVPGNKLVWLRLLDPRDRVQWQTVVTTDMVKTPRVMDELVEMMKTQYLEYGTA